MKKIAMIPSRYQSSRFPGKPLAIICGKPMIQHVYESVAKADGIDEVYVATDDKKIFSAVEEFNGKVIMTSPYHTCGTDRINECADILNLDNEDTIINIQGDEPLINKKTVEDIADILDTDKNIYMATLKKKITDIDELNNPNVVKVICDVLGNAIYFSRYPIPYKRNLGVAEHYKHIGVYSYRRWFLEKFSKMDRLGLEQSESLEQLRVIEAGYKIKVIETEYETLGVDTPEQLMQVEKILKGK